MIKNLFAITILILCGVLVWNAARAVTTVDTDGNESALLTIK